MQYCSYRIMVIAKLVHQDAYNRGRQADDLIEFKYRYKSL